MIKYGEIWYEMEDQAWEVDDRFKKDNPRKVWITIWKPLWAQEKLWCAIISEGGSLTYMLWQKVFNKATFHYLLDQLFLSCPWQLILVISWASSKNLFYELHVYASIWGRVLELPTKPMLGWPAFPMTDSLLKAHATIPCSLIPTISHSHVLHFYISNLIQLIPCH